MFNFNFFERKTMKKEVKEEAIRIADDLSELPVGSEEHYTGAKSLKEACDAYSKIKEHDINVNTLIGAGVSVVLFVATMAFSETHILDLKVPNAIANATKRFFGR